MATYGFGITVPLPVEEAERHIREALKAEGFGVLTEIDVQTTLKEKLGVTVRPYRILGVCNPHLAHQALEREPEIGLLLPCNVVVRTVDDGTRVEIADPQAMLGIASNEQLQPIAAEARARLERALQVFAATATTQRS